VKYLLTLAYLKHYGLTQPLIKEVKDLYFENYIESKGEVRKLLCHIP